MDEKSFDSYTDFWKWSVENREAFWKLTIDQLDITFHKKYDSILNLEKGVTNPKWLEGAELNIVDSCFKNDSNAIAIKYHDGETLKKVTYGELETLVNRVANGLYDLGLQPHDTVAIDMPMTMKSVAIYLGIIKAGLKVATIADSFAEDEIEIRLNITEPKLIFTQDFTKRGQKTHDLYKKLSTVSKVQIVAVHLEGTTSFLRAGDLYWDQFLSSETTFNSLKCRPQRSITYLFSSGTTGTPKAIPWDHTTPIKCASDAFYHHNIQQGDVVCWPTNLGWMMGPWLVFASLINNATIGLYYGVPMEKEFGKFLEESEVTMLGVIPSIVKSWKNTASLENYDLSKIKCFSSTGEVSNPEEMEYLMQLAGGKPIIEYCGGTEIGGGYISSTLLQENVPSTFSTPTLGTDFVLLDENGKPSNEGEVFIIPPIMGLSNTLLNKDHYKTYYADTPEYKNQLRRHGDALKLADGYYRILGRTDDSMNIKGMKISSVAIESVINALDFVNESAAIAIAPEDGGPNRLIVYYVEQTKVDTFEALKQARAIVKEKLNPQFKIDEFIKLDALPRTASNKIKRKLLRENYSK